MRPGGRGLLDLADRTGVALDGDWQREWRQVRRRHVHRSIRTSQQRVARSSRARPAPGRACRRRGPPRPRESTSNASPSPSASGMPNARATIAACPVGAPPARATPATSSGRSSATIDASRSSAATTAGSPAGVCSDGRGRPWRIAATRLPTSRMSAARARKYSSSRAARTSACLAAASPIASAAASPSSAIAARAWSTRAGSRANSAWASKIAATSAPARVRVCSASSASSCAARSSARRRRSCSRRRSAHVDSERSTDGRLSRPDPDQASNAGPRRSSPALENVSSHVCASLPAVDHICQRTDQQRRGCCSGILVADAALAEIRRTAFRREHRDRRLRRPLPPPHAQRQARRSSSRPESSAACAAAAAGTSASSIVFSPVVERPSDADAVSRGLHRGHRIRDGWLLRAGVHSRRAEKCGPVERTRSTTNCSDQRLPRLAKQSANRLARAVSVRQSVGRRASPRWR